MSTSARGAPHLNGKVERSHRTDDQEFYQLLDQGGITDDIHLFNEKLRDWEDYVLHPPKTERLPSVGYGPSNQEAAWDAKRK